MFAARIFVTSILLSIISIFIFAFDALQTSMPLLLANTSPISQTTIPTTTLVLSDTLTVLETRIANIEQRLEIPTKDFWDKADAISGILSGVIVALIGLLATHTYNQRQLANQKAQRNREITISQVQTVQTFMPQLQSGNEREVEAALLAIAALGNTNLATELASLYRTPGSIFALHKMSLSSNREIAQQAKLSLDNLLGVLNLRNAFVEILSGESSKNVSMCSGFIIDKRGYIATVSYGVNNQEHIKIKLLDKTYNAKVIALHPEYMLALLKIDAFEQEVPNFHFMSIVSSDDVKVSDRVFLLGPKFITGEQTLSIGQVTGIHLKREEALINFIAIDVDTAPGFGGAPVLNQFGQVVGMHTINDRGQRFMIPSYYIIELVKDILGTA